MVRKPDDQLGERETVERREAALKRMLSTPPKPHDQMKVGKGKGATTPKRRRAQRSRD